MLNLLNSNQLALANIYRQLIDPYVTSDPPKSPSLDSTLSINFLSTERDKEHKLALSSPFLPKKLKVKTIHKTQFVLDKERQMEARKNNLQKVLQGMDKMLKESFVLETQLQNEFNQEKQYQRIENIHWTDDQIFPSLKIDWIGSVEQFEKGMVLKSLESRIEQKIWSILKGDKVSNLIQKLFWLVMLEKFPKVCSFDTKVVYYELVAKLRAIYAQLFVELTAEVRTKEKDEIITIILFSTAYIVNYIYFILFPFNKHDFQIRFILDTFHLLFFIVNGLYISDFYLVHNFERYFTVRFLEYQRMDHPIFRRKNEEKQDQNIFCPQKIDQSDVPEFITEIRDKLSNRRQLVFKKTTNNYEVQRDIQKEEPKLTNMHINCIQISPALGGFLDNKKLQLPSKSNKIIKHVLEKVGSQKEMDELVKKYKQELKKKTEEKITFGNKSKYSLSRRKKQLPGVTMYNHKQEYDEKAKKYPH